MSVLARYDVVVAGAGLAGLFAGALAARRGAQTLVIARGIGGTHLGAGTVDLWGYAARAPGASADGQSPIVSSPLAELEKLEAPHPLALAGLPALGAALAEYQQICAAADYALIGDIEHNHLLPTALGAVRPACLAPESFLAGDVQRTGELTLARLPGFRDFYADMAEANLRAAGFDARAVTLNLPNTPARRDLFATDYARSFDDRHYRDEAARAWGPALSGVTRLGLPAFLGLEQPRAAWRHLQEQLGVQVFEIPIAPPSVPGMRVFNLLRSAIEGAGGRMILGPRLRGWVENGRARGVIAETAGGPRNYQADGIILATGGFRHGGLESPAQGEARESVFDLPVKTGEHWFAPLSWAPQPYAAFGVRVNSRMQPIDADGAALFPNVFAAGGLLAGADRLTEGSREGIDLATAHRAVQGITYDQ